MTIDSSFNITYRVHSGVVSSIKDTSSVMVTGAGKTLELSLDLFRVLMAFARPSTIRHAFKSLEVNVDIAEFASLVEEYVACGLLTRVEAADSGRSLGQLICPRLFLDPVAVGKARRWLRDGHALVIPDALPIEFAEQVHRDLDRSYRWAVAEGGHDFFHYRNCVMSHLGEQTPALAECCRLFTCEGTQRFISDLSGEDCGGEAGTAAAWYRPGEYALPHDDTATRNSRSVAYIWYMTKDWRREWGGALYWCPTGQYVVPRFNVLIIFRVMPSNVHLVCPVAPGATEKRLTINGFWHRAHPRAAPSPHSPELLVSPHAYGQSVPINEIPPPLVVL